ncbi:XdhC family protein [Nocardia shimofusensis]|uniref:XdhC family protein n=1 Tax=Nocardia shimofusensis TaxID=228596 RepID=UPI000837A34A|nr:XdhC/CoxI family protein [Nocardia shimofusensis]
MRDIVDDLLQVWYSGRTGGLATVVRSVGDGRWPVGSALLVDPDGVVHGAGLGGSVDDAIRDAAATAARTGRRAMHRLPVPTGEPGVAVGATIDVFAEPFSQHDFTEFPTVAAEIAAHRRVTVFTVVWNPDTDLIGQHLITDKRHNTELVALPESDIFVASFAPAPRMIIFGANAYAAALTVQARLLGYRVTICDSREEFAAPEAFPGAEVVVDWPHRYLNTLAGAGEIDASTAIVAFAHDPKFEIPLLTVALRLTDLGYLGAAGSYTAHLRRMEDLRAGGFDEAALSRLHSPAGLDVGAHTPAETAVAIIAELLAVRTGRDGGSLSQHGAALPATGVFDGRATVGL